MSPDVAQYIEELHETLRKLEHHNQQYQKREARHQDIIAHRAQDIRTLKDEKSAAIAGLTNANAQLSSMRADIERMKDRFLRMQPVNVVSDAQIGEKYDMLCDDIRDWIETEFHDVGSLFRDIYKAATASQKYLEMIGVVLDDGLFELMKENENAS